MTETKVVIIPIDAPFLRVLARRVADRFRSSLPDLSNLLVVFPSQRNKFYFRRYLLEESGRHALIPPAMKTVEELIDMIYEALGGKPAKLLNKTERNFMLKGVVDALRVEFWHDLDFLRFAAIGDRLLTFFDELAQEQLTLDRIREFVKAGHYPERYVENELPILEDIFRCYRQRLKEGGFEDEIDKFDLVFNRFNSDTLKSYDQAIIAGLAATTAVEKKVIGEILRDSASELVLHSGSREELKEEGLDNPFHSHARLLAALTIDPEKIVFEPAPPPPPPVHHVRSVASETQQALHLRAVLDRVRGQYPPHRIGIVLADETGVDPVTETLRSAGLEFNLSLGFPFTKSLLYSFLSSLFSVVDTDCHYREFFAFLKHPLIKNGTIGLLDLRPMVYGLERLMVEERFNHFDPELCAREEFLPLVGLVTTCVNAGRARLPLGQYIEAFIELLSTIISYNQELMKTHAAEIREFFDRLQGLGRLRLPATRDVSLEPITPGAPMLEFILRQLKSAAFNLFGDPMRGVQVVGLLEARNLDFDCVILPGLNEGVFPRKTEKDLFINHEVRRHIGLPYDKERDNLALYYFTGLARGKQETFISYVIEEKRDIRSRFVDFLIEQGAASDDSKLALRRQAVAVKDRSVAKDKPLLDFLYKSVRTRGLSPSALKDFTICPYRYYLRYLVGVREPDTIVEEPGALEWGQIVHAALKNFYAYDYPEGFGPADLTPVRARLGSRLEAALASTLARKPKRSAFFDLRLWQRRLDRFAEFELKRFGEGFAVDAARLEKYIDGHVEVGNLTIKLKGYVDRVDRRNGTPCIIDYKTGSLPAQKDYTPGDDFTEFQLPLYGLVLCQGDYGKIGDLAYYSVGKKPEVCSIPGRLDTDIPTYLDRFNNEVLLPALEALIDPARPFAQNRSEDACRYCSYATLCGTAGTATHGYD